jgi:hypothetical protein
MKVIISSAVFFLGVICAPLVCLHSAPEIKNSTSLSNALANQDGDILHSSQFQAGVKELRNSINTTTVVLLGK